MTSVVSIQKLSEEKLTELAKEVDAELRRRFGDKVYYILLFGEPGRVEMMSNVNEHIAIAALADTLEKMRKGLTHITIPKRVH